jgi:hypothetical protein
MISSFASAAAKIQRHILLRPESTSIDFEMAYKVRAAIDKIKFSIKQIESSEPASVRRCTFPRSIPFNAEHRPEVWGKSGTS